MKYFTVLFLFWLSPFIVLSQTTTNTCADYVSSAEEKLIGLTFADSDQIETIITDWRSICGFSEPANRLEIALRIFQNKFTTKLGTSYYNDCFVKLEERIQAEQLENFEQKYNQNQSSFYYLPLRSKFDGWLIDQCLSLKPVVAPESMEEALLYSFLGNTEFGRSYFRPQQASNTDDLIGEFVIRTGISAPIGRYQTQIPASVLIQFGLSFKVYKNWWGDIQMGVIPFSKTVPSIVQIKTQKTSSLSSSVVTIGLAAGQNFNLNDHWRYSWRSGLSYLSLDTDIKKDLKSTGSDTTTFALSSFAFAIGNEISYKIRSTYIGIYVAYNFMPFTIDNRLLTAINPHRINIALSLHR